jgi:tetratricopeptide (TPR) repeat protein
MFGDSDLVFVRADKLKERRRGVSQEEVAHQASIGLRTLQTMEGAIRDGVRRPVKWQNVRAVADVLAISPYDLIDRDLTPIAPDTFSTSIIDVSNLYARYRLATAETSPLKCVAALKNVLEALRPFAGERHEVREGLARLEAQTLSRLAELEQRYDERLEYRQRAVKLLQAEFSAFADPLDLVSLSDCVVDCFFEGFASLSKKGIQRTIRETLLSIWSITHSTTPLVTEARVHLLTQAASLHRCAALSFHSVAERAKRLGTALRCADTACSIAPRNADALLSRGQAAWYHGANVEAASGNYLRQAEADMRDAAHLGYPLAYLVLARFYRHTYRSDLCVTAFREYENRESTRRRVLCEAHVIGEAAWQLWMHRGTSSLAEVEIARNLLSEAVEAGHGTARHVIDLAILEGILGSVDVATALLARLQNTWAPTGEEPTTWLTLIGTALQYAESGDVDALRRMFTFGFDNVGAWNSLGTFALEFLDDDILALRLYDVGLKLSPKSHYAWLNKARVLSRLGKDSDAEYARKTARQFAPHVFLPFIIDDTSK